MNYEERKKADISFMKKALLLSKRAYANGDVPIGAIIVKNEEIVGTGYNKCELNTNPLLHAEIIAIDDASKNLNNRLYGTTMYVTLEPCPMCAGAILNARINRLVFGAKNKEWGSTGSIANLFAMDFPVNPPSITYGVLEDECSQILKDFFKCIRK